MKQAAGGDRYVLPHEMHEFQRGEAFLFFDPVNFVWFQTDHLGKAVIDGLARGGGLPLAARQVARLAAAPVADAEVYAARVVEQLVKIGFLHREEYRPRPFAPGIAKVPFILYVHMTSRCNLQCPYCYNQENRSQLWRAPVGSYQQFEQLIDEAAEIGFTDVKFTGGEALLNKDTLPLARHARAKGMWVNLLTNGTLIDERNARAVVEATSSVSLSLDSARPHEHDAVRGKDTWQKVLRAIRLLKEAGLGHLHLNSVVTPVNKESIHEFLDFAWDEMKAQKVTLAPTGIDVSDPASRWGAQTFMLSSDDMWEVYRSQRAYSQRKAAEQPPVVSRDSLRRTQCGAANGVVSVDSNGDLYPCQTMHLPEMRCGNVFETGLRHVLENSGLLHQLRHTTVDRLEDCPGCPMRYVCSGGCRMEAYSREGSITARARDLCPIFFHQALDKLWLSANLPAETADQPRVGTGRPLNCFESYT